MLPFSRRAVLGLLTAGLPVGVLTACQGSRNGLPSPPIYRNVVAENQLPGADDWRPGTGGSRSPDDRHRQIQGYCSATSVTHGQTLTFHVSVDTPQSCTVTIYRLGWYGGAGARHLVTSEPLSGRTHPVPAAEPDTGRIECQWPPLWRLTVPADWVPGLYLATFENEHGYRACTPFVVRDDRRSAALCVVVPFTTYQAYNIWPSDGSRGKSLYYGYSAAGASLDPTQRAFQVSYDRPYSGNGWPKLFDRDHDFVQWVERSGYDVTYASTEDLHAGRIDPARYRGLVFCGHDEYWSAEMRQAASQAVDRGLSLAFLTANNVYWQIRYAPATDGRAHRVVTCYKVDPDPEPGADGRRRTVRWRDLSPDGADAEQGLLGVQYNGIVARAQPLVVRASDHWFWAGTGLSDGDRIPRLVGGEADGRDPSMPVPDELNGTILSASPYPLRNGARLEQNTYLYETRRGAIVFDAGTLHWTLGLNRKGFRHQAIQIATSNLFNRMIAERGV